MVEREEEGFLPSTSVQDTPSHQVEKTSGAAQNVDEGPGILVTVSTETLPAQLSSTRSDSKEGIDELCPVCGDKVSGYHYGLLTCESCKGFFKRTVQNKKMYTCVAERTCHIDKSQRKRCPYCRFQKCLEVGMKLEAVRADRMRGGRNKFGPMYKRERARKMQMMRQKQMSICGGEGGSNSAVVSTTPPPSLANFAGTLSLSYSTAASPGGVKQELIQIPQLSSSTSSPESSPPFASPGSGSTSSSEQQKPPLWPPATQYEAGSTTTTAATATHPLVAAKMCSPLIQDLQVALVDDKEWQTQLFGLLHSQTYNQCEVDTFELLCKVVDQCLFTQVDWARNSIYFKELKVDDQMKLLQSSWSDLLLLDHIHQRLHLGLPDETTMPNGQKFDLMSLALLGLPSMADQLLRLMSNLQILKFDPIDYICLKFLLLLNPEVKNLNNLKLVQEAYDQAQQALLDYTLAAYPQITDKFRLMMMHINEMRAIGAKGEEYLYYKHINGNAPTQTLLMEMLHARKK